MEEFYSAVKKSEIMTFIEKLVKLKSLLKVD